MEKIFKKHCKCPKCGEVLILTSEGSCCSGENFDTLLSDYKRQLSERIRKELYYEDVNSRLLRIIKDLEE